MGLEEYGEGNGTFLKIKHGCICQESKTEKEGYKKVDGTLSDGTPWQKWIRPYKAVSGYVDKIERYDREHDGRKFRGWNIVINDEGTQFFLDIPFNSRVNGRWMKLAESIDYTKPVRFSAWHDKKSDSTALNVQQDGVTVPQKYTREDPGDMPQPVQRSSGKWDYGAQEDFLCERLLKFVAPNVEMIAANRNGVGETTHGGGLEESDEVIQGEVIDYGNPVEALKRSINALAGSRAVDGASAEALMEQYLGTTDWADVAKKPENFLKAQIKALDDMIPF